MVFSSSSPMSKFSTLEEKYNLPSGLLSAVMKQESGGNPRALSPKGAAGSFQFMPATAKQYGIDPYDPDQAADGAAQMFGDLSQKYGGDLPSMLAAYNWGQGNVDRKGLGNAPLETRDYISKITDALGGDGGMSTSPMLTASNTIDGKFGMQLPDNTQAGGLRPAGQMAQQMLMQQMGGLPDAQMKEKQDRGVLEGALQNLINRQGAYQAPSQINEPLMRMAAGLAGKGSLHDMFNGYADGAQNQSKIERDQEMSNIQMQAELEKLKHGFLTGDVDDAQKAMQLANQYGGTGMHQSATDTIVKQIMNDHPDWSYTQALHYYQTGMRRDMQLDENGNVKLTPGATGATAAMEGTKEGAKEGAKALQASYDEATKDKFALGYLKNARTALDNGIFSGRMAEFNLENAKKLKAVGLLPEDYDEKIANTEVFGAQMATQVLSNIKALGSGTAISDADREYVQKIVGGNIKLDETSLRKLLDIGEQTIKDRVRMHNKKFSAAKEGGFAPLYDLNVDIGDEPMTEEIAAAPTMTLEQMKAERAKRNGGR